MPVIKSAKKKLKQDKKRTLRNTRVEDLFKSLVKKAKKLPSEKTVREAVSAVDKGAKKNIIHKNKAARMKSALAKLLSGKTVNKAVAPKTKNKAKTSKKKSSKKS